MSRVFLGLLAALPICFSFAEDLSLEGAVEAALRQSPNVQKSEAAAESASWKVTETYSGFLPSLSASSTYLTNKKYLFTDIDFGGAPTSVPAIVPTSNFYLMAQLPLFDGFASTQKLRSAWANESSHQSELDWTKFKLQREVSLQYYRTLGAQVLKDVAEQNLKTLSDHLRDVNLFKKSGLSTSFDVLRVDVQVSEAKSELMNSEDNLAIAKDKLAELLGEENEERQLSGKLPILEAKVIEGKNIQVDSGRADIKSLSEKTRSAALKASASNKFWVPRLAAFAQYQYYNNLNDSFTDTKHYRNAYQVGLSLNWNIFDGMYSYAKSEEDIQERVQNEKDLRMLQLKSKHDLEFWKRRYNYYCSMYQSRKGDVQKSEESVRLADEGRRAGTRTSTDQLDAESELFRAKAGVVNAQLGAVESLLNLELTTGTELYKFN
jgi:outer membrane protein TolC